MNTMYQDTPTEDIPSLEQQVLRFLHLNTGVQPTKEMTLLEMCKGNRDKVKSLVYLLGMAMQDQFSDDLPLAKIQNKTVEFVVWLVERNFGQSSEEFSG